MSSKKNKSSIGTTKPSQRIGKGGSKKKMRLLKAERGPLASSDRQVLQVNAPVATAAVTRRAVSKPVIIEMTEEVSNVLVGPDFVNTPLIINPGNHELFPWLSIVARAFTSYLFEALRFRYVAATATQVAGDVVLVVNADPDKDPFIDEKQALNHEGSAMGAPWVSFGINGKQKTTQSVVPTKYVADTTEAVDLTSFFDDLRLIADGVVQVFTGLKNIFSTEEQMQRQLRATLRDIGLKDSDIEERLRKQNVKLTDDPIVTGKLFVDYRVRLTDPVDSEDPQDNGYNYINNIASISSLSYGIAPCATADVIYDDHSIWKTGWADAPTTADACHIGVTNPALSSGYQSWFNVRDPGFYQVELMENTGVHYDFTDALIPSLHAAPDGSAFVVPTFALSNITWGAEGTNPEDKKSKTPKSSTTPSGTFQTVRGSWLVEVKNSSELFAGQFYIQDVGGAGPGSIARSDYNGLNCYLTINRVAEDIALARLRALARTTKMSLPDCPVNHAIGMIRKRNHLRKSNQLSSSVSTLLKQTCEAKQSRESVDAKSSSAIPPTLKVDQG